MHLLAVIVAFQVDSDFDADTLTTGGDAEANLGDFDFNLMNLPIKHI